MKIIKIELQSSWVFERREDDVLPIEYICKFVSDSYGDLLEVVDSGITDVNFKVINQEKDYADVVKNIKENFIDNYKIEDSSIIDINIVEQVESQPESETETNDETKTNANGGEKTDGSLSAMEKINNLVGCDEFKALSKEIVQISKQIIKNKTFDVFSNQTYIFSINDGYGLSTYLKLFLDLLSSLKICSSSGSGLVIEEKLPAPKGDSIEPFMEVERILKNGRNGMLQLLCIDISEWLNNIHNRLFKEFLNNVERYMKDFIIVFRIPFVDTEVLEGVKYSINDLMFVRTVSFAPFTKQEIQNLAKAEFDKYGFVMSKSGWDGFHLRIAEEKCDGKFYGINTIKKVVSELLYFKELNNARKNINSLSISKNDTMKICSNCNDGNLSGYEMLDKLVGAKGIKERIQEIVSQIEMANKDATIQSPCVHMRFVGNPGTGKTTVARILGKILKEKGLLRTGNFFEYAGRDFCGRYIGETAPKTSSMCRDAYGSVLFIDEAYSLYRGEGNEKDYGKEAIDTLIAEMENHRSDLVVIMAGYTDDMEKLMQANAGLASRMPYVINFPNFSRDELYDVFLSMINKRAKYDEQLLDVVKDYFNNIPEDVIKSKDFSNARFVRNLFERTWAKASMRCQLSQNKNFTITKSDFERSISDNEFKFMLKKKNRIGF